MARARKRPKVGLNLGRWLLQLVLPLLAVASLIAGVIWLGRLARDDMRRRDGPSLAFADIECLPPPGMTRGEFLEETRYLAGMTEKLDPFDETLAERLRLGLGAHPWVASVRRVRVSAGGAAAEVEYRTPILWIEQFGRAVDVAAVTLPVSASRDGLAVLANKVKPAGRVGAVWDDPDVLAAAKVMARLREEPRAIELSGLRVTVEAGDVTLRREKQTIIWGRPPGDERGGEPNAETKLTRLAEAARSGKGVDLRK